MGKSKTTVAAGGNAAVASEIDDIFSSSPRPSRAPASRAKRHDRKPHPAEHPKQATRRHPSRPPHLLPTRTPSRSESGRPTQPHQRSGLWRLSRTHPPRSQPALLHHLHPRRGLQSLRLAMAHLTRQSRRSWRSLPIRAVGERGRRPTMACASFRPPSWA